MAEQLQSDVMQTNIEAAQTASDRGKFLIKSTILFSILKIKLFWHLEKLIYDVKKLRQINYSCQSCNAD